MGGQEEEDAQCAYRRKEDEEEDAQRAHTKTEYVHPMGWATFAYTCVTESAMPPNLRDIMLRMSICYEF
jgi:hypothetical protein